MGNTVMHQLGEDPRTPSIILGLLSLMRMGCVAHALGRHRLRIYLFSHSQGGLEVPRVMG
jgi:hypothetical protein